MKPIFSLLFCATAALFAAPSHASGLEDLARALPPGQPAAGAVVPSRPVPVAWTADPSGDNVLGFGERICWRRGKDQAADRLRMPESLCLRSMKIHIGGQSGPELELSGDGLGGVFALNLGPLHDGLLKASAIIFNRVPLIQVCASAEAAYIELSVLIDERGRIVSEPELRSYYGTTPDTCASPWNYRETGHFGRIR